MRPFAFALLTILAVLARPYSLLAHPGSGIAVDGHGHVFFCDTGAGLWVARSDGSLHLVSQSPVHWLAAVSTDKVAKQPANFGRWIETVTPPNSDRTLALCSDYPCAADAEGRIVLSAGLPPHRLVRRQPDGREIPVAIESLTETHPLNSGLITGLAVAPDGTIVVMSLGAQPTEHALLAVSPEGEVETRAKNFIQLPGNLSAFEGSLCRGIACDARGGVYVAATRVRQVVYVDTAGKSRVVLTSVAPWSPTGIAVSGDDVYVLEYTDTPPGADPHDRTLWIPRVRKIARDGSASLISEVKRTTGASNPVGH